MSRGASRARRSTATDAEGHAARERADASVDEAAEGDPSDATGARDRWFFAVALGLLLAMALWWCWLLVATLEREHALRVAELEARAALAATRSSESATDPDSTEAPEPPDLRALPGLAELEARRARRRLMAFGEGALLLVLVFVSALMLRRLVRAETRRREQLQELAARVTDEVAAPVASLRASLAELSELSERDERDERDERGATQADAVAEEMARIARRALADAERSEHLVEAVLVAHRLSIRGTRLDGAPLDLAELARRFAEHRHRTMHVAEDALAVEAPTNAHRVVADADAVLLALDCLADDLAERGATVVTVRVRAEGVSLLAAEEIAPSPGGLRVDVTARLARAMRGALRAEAGGWTLHLPSA